MSPAGELGRRDLLRAATAAGVLTVAGCASDEGDDSSTTNATANATDSQSSGGGKPQQRPITGTSVPELRSMEEAMLEYMRERDITAGVLAVSRYGEVVYERGFGWSDRSRSKPVSSDALFRVGSVSKTLTDAAIRRLVEESEISSGEYIYPYLEAEIGTETPADARFHEIELRHLYAHQGGWDRREASDPLFDPLAVSDELGLDDPPDRGDIVRYVLDEPLQFDPGERSVYSNVGYSLLATIVEAVSGRPYHEYLREEILEPAGAGDVRPGRTAPEERPSREVAYDDSEECPNALTLDPDDRVPCADSGIVLEALEGAAGHVASADALLAFMDDYWLNGEPREAADREWVYFGSLPGSFAMVVQRTDGVDVAALFNRRTGDAESIHPMLSRAIDRVEEWPY